MSAQYYSYNRGFIKIKGGADYPLKPSAFFSDENVNYSSYLNIGYLEGIEIGYYFSQNIGLSIGLLSNQSSVDSDSYAKDFLSGTQTLSSVNIGQFFSGSFYFGLLFDLPFSEYCSMTSKLALGSFMVWRPAGEIQYYDQGVLTSYSEKRELASSFSPMFGLGTKIKLIEKMSLFVDAEYQFGNFVFSKQDGTEQIKMIMLSIGLSYNFL